MGMGYLQVRTERSHHDEDHSRKTPSQMLRVFEATGASMRKHDYASAAVVHASSSDSGESHAEMMGAKQSRRRCCRARLSYRHQCQQLPSPWMFGRMLADIVAQLLRRDRGP